MPELGGHLEKGRQGTVSFLVSLFLFFNFCFRSLWSLPFEYPSLEYSFVFVFFFPEAKAKNRFKTSGINNMFLMDFFEDKRWKTMGN